MTGTGKATMPGPILFSRHLLHFGVGAESAHSQRIARTKQADLQQRLFARKGEIRCAATAPRKSEGKKNGGRSPRFAHRVEPDYLQVPPTAHRAGVAAGFQPAPAQAVWLCSAV